MVCIRCECPRVTLWVENEADDHGIYECDECHHKFIILPEQDGAGEVTHGELGIC